MSARISLVVAMARNGVIGKDNRLPWHLPADLKRFRALTWGHPIIMGRKTFDSIGRALPGRCNLVLTRNPDWQVNHDVTPVRSLDEAIAACADATEIFVIGGAELYRLAMPRAQRIYLTRVDASIDGDARFDAFQPEDWRELQCEHLQADAANPYACDFLLLERSPEV